jgi:hypothetical protein
VKLAYAEQLLVFGCVPDDIAAQFGLAYDSDDDRDVRHAIRCIVAPYFARWDDESKAEARKVWAELLISGDDEWLADAWEADLPPVDLPREPLRFAQLLWEELWPGEDPATYHEPDAEIDPDPTACNRMRVAPARGPEIAPDLLDLPSRAT